VPDLRLVDVLLLLGMVGVLEVRHRPGAPGPGLGLVHQHQRGVVVAVLEQEGDARLFQKPAHEGVVALTVLDLDLQLGVAPAIDLPRRLHAPLAEDHVDDVRDAQVLEDAVPAALGEQPQEGDDFDHVGGEPRRRHRLHLPGVGAQARPQTIGQERELDGALDAEAGGLPDQRREIEAGIRREGPHGHAEERGDGLVDHEAPHRKGALAGREVKL